MNLLCLCFLRQKGSPESKKLAGAEEVDQEPDPTKPTAPWPMRRGDGWLSGYQHSLSIAFFSLFLVSVYLHVRGGATVYNIENIEQAHEGEPLVTVWGYMHTSRFGFESFQNWQSEMGSIFSLVGFTIFPRQQSSPQSKPVGLGLRDWQISSRATFSAAALGGLILLVAPHIKLLNFVRGLAHAASLLYLCINQSDYTRRRNYYFLLVF